MGTPLDIAGQSVMIAWSTRELPGNTAQIEGFLGYALALAGIRDINGLKAKKIAHGSVFGSLNPRPNAVSRAEVEEAIRLLDALAATREPVVVPPGRSLATGVGWEYPVATAADIRIEDIYYEAPLDAEN